MSLGSLLDDQHWHHVTVEHHGSHLNLTVDKNTLWVQIPLTFTHWDYDQVCFCWLTLGKQNIQMSSASILKWLCVIVFCLCFYYTQMSVGTDQDLDSQRSVGSHRNFHGCLENLVYNNVNLVDLAKQKNQRVIVKVNCLKACVFTHCGNSSIGVQPISNKNMYALIPIWMVLELIVSQHIKATRSISG